MRTDGVPVRSIATVGLGVGAAWVALGVHTARVQPWTVDDAYVTFRYAERWAAGLGPTYNDGEWVEGYTSVAWLGILTLAHAIGFDTEHTATILGITAAALVPVVVVALRPPGMSIGAGSIAAALTGACGVLTGWAGGGLEVAPAVLAAAVACGAALRRAWVGAGLAAAVAATLRPELALLVPVLAAGAFAASDRRGAAIVGGIGVAVLGGVEVWRLATYGAWLPNTFHAKVGATSAQVVRGLGYGAGFVRSVPLLVGLAAVGLARARPSWEGGAVLIWAVAHATFVVAVGGDGLPAWRFFAPVLPVLGWLAALAVDGWAGAWPIAALVAVSEVAAVSFDAETARLGAEPVSRNGREVGLYLRDRYPPDTWIATNTAGSVPYFSGLPTIDMLGLCDAHIAGRTVAGMGRRKAGHEKFDGAYVLSRAPDLVLFGGARGRPDPFFPSDRALWAQPGFREAYGLERHTLPSGATLAVWVRRPQP